MKKFLLSVVALSAFVSVKAQTCSQIFISEYVEGYGNNKAIEIYNPSSSPIGLEGNYRLVRFDNGSSEAATNATTQVQVSLGNHVLAPHEAWVIALDQRDPNGTGTTAPIDSALEAVADTFLCPDYNVSKVMFFNGNDGLAIQKNVSGTWTDVDIFAAAGDAGMTGNNGTGGWGSQFPYDNATGVDAWTLNHTLIRKHTVEQGVTVNPNPFIVSQEWDSLHVDTYTNLGTHTCDCYVAGVNNIEKVASVKMYPNPTNTGVFTVAASEKIEAVLVYTIAGEKVIQKEGNKMEKQVSIETGELAKGMYLVKVVFSNNRTQIMKLSVN